MKKVNKQANDTAVGPKNRTTVALVTAIVLLLVSGLGYRALADYFTTVSNGTPLPRGTLARLPLVIGSWEGSEVPLDERIVQATDTDDHVSRTYARGRAGQVNLFIAYGMRMRDLMPHRPEVCYPGAGWTLESRQVTEVPLEDDTTLPVQMFLFSEGGLGSVRTVVLSYYIIDGTFSQDVALLRSKAWKPGSKIRYVAQIQVTAPALRSVNMERVERNVRDFAAASAPHIRDLLESETQIRVASP